MSVEWAKDNKIYIKELHCSITSYFCVSLTTRTLEQVLIYAPLTTEIGIYCRLTWDCRARTNIADCPCLNNFSVPSFRKDMNNGETP